MVQVQQSHTLRGWRRAGLALLAALGVGLASAQAAPPGGVIRSPIPGVPDAYTEVPQEFFTSVPEVPGTGSTVSTFQLSYAPPILPKAQNQYWQELERRLGVTLNANPVSAETYREKLATTIAGGDIPDITVLLPDAMPEQYQPIFQGAFIDLTPYLTGDALKQYPNLARIPAYLWENVKIDGKIYGVPRETFRTGSVFVFREDWLEAVGRERPTNAEEFFELMVAFTEDDPDGNGKNDTWGLSGNQLSRGFFESMFRVPNGWRVNEDGTLTSAVETPEYKEMLAYMRRLWEAGVFHPDTLTTQNFKDPFTAGAFGGMMDGPGALPGARGLRVMAKEVTPSAEVGALVPPGFDGGEAVTYNNRGYWGFAAISYQNTEPERIEELLRVLDFYAAPYGSQENLFLTNGVEGIGHTVNPDGTRTVTEQGQAEHGDLNYLTTAPTVFGPDIPGEARFMQETLEAHLRIGVDNPTLTLYSPTQIETAAQLGQMQDDKVIAIVTGREPLESWDAFVEAWRAQGGNQVRAEYEAAMGQQNAAR